MRQFFENAVTTLVAGVIAVVVVLLAVMYFIPGVFVSKAKIIKNVEEQGYSNVVVDDKDVFFVRLSGCSRSDDAAFEISATNAAGVDVDIVACTGWPLKGTTIRTN